MKSRLKASLAHWKHELPYVQFAFGALLIFYPFLTILLPHIETAQHGVDFNPYYFVALLFRHAPESLFVLKDLPSYQHLLVSAGAPALVSVEYFGFIYPPSSLFLFAPLAYLSYWNAFYVWMGVLVVTLVASSLLLFLLAKRLHMGEYAALFASLMWFNIGSYSCVYVAQISMLLCLGLLVVILAVLHARYVLAAIVLALIAHVKPQHFAALSLVCFFALPRRFQMSLVLVHIGIIAATTAVLGADIWGRFITFIGEINASSFGGSPNLDRMPTLQGILADAMAETTPFEHYGVMACFAATLIFAAVLGLRSRKHDTLLVPSMASACLTSWFFSPWFHNSDGMYWVVMATLVWAVAPVRNEKWLVAFLIVNFLAFMLGFYSVVRLLLVALLVASVVVLHQVNRQRVQAL